MQQLESTTDSLLTKRSKTAICITTRNRSDALAKCLESLAMLTVQPTAIVVSDDSTNEAIELENRSIVQKHSNCVYLKGPRKGVCANRNNALRTALQENPDFISFVDDDICLDRYFLENAIEAYSAVSEKNRTRTIFTGAIEQARQGTEGLKLTFRGYFAESSKPEVVNIHSAIFPSSLFRKVAWDENIFFGYEDAELCLRAKKNGFIIVTLSSLKSLDMAYGNGTLAEEGEASKSSDYQIYIEAARLYVGIKRYKHIYFSPVLLIVFLGLYFPHIILFLIKRGELDKLSRIIKIAKIDRLFNNNIPDSI
jgi:GT2 family glycosyltransferase